MQELALEARFMWEVGVSTDHSGQYWGIVIGIIGDWPFLHKCAGFERSFNNIQKRVTVRRDPVGICHRCKAGHRGYDFEQVQTRRPCWLATQYVEDPFTVESPLATHLLHVPGEEAGLWCYDWFHTMHLGVLKNFLGSVLALFSEQENHSQVDQRFQALTADYKRWCVQNKRRMYVTQLSKEKISWEKTRLFPTGTWHKGALTVTLMDYVEFRFLRETFDEPMLGLAADACFAIQKCTRTLYKSSLWLEPAACRQVAEQGFQFLRRYAQLATVASNMGRSLWIFQPKIHCLHHFLTDMWYICSSGDPTPNPLGWSCQPSEDFIGRPSRLSRRVTAQAPVLHRIMDRYLMSVYDHFISSGFLVRSTG